MEATQLLPLHDLIVRIIRNALAYKRKMTQAADSSLEEYIQLQMDKTQNVDFSKLEASIKSATDVHNFLDQFGFKLSFMPDYIVSKTKDIVIKDHEYMISVSICVFLNYIAWHSYFMRSHDPDYFNCLILALTKVAKANTGNEYYIIAISCVINAYDVFLKFGPHTWKIEYIDNLVDFYSLEQLIPQSAYDILGRVASTVLPRDSRSFDGVSRHLIEVFNKIIQTIGRRIPTNILVAVLSLVKDAIESGDVAANLILQRAAPYLPKEAAYQFFAPVSISFLNHIEKFPTHMIPVEPSSPITLSLDPCYTVNFKTLTSNRSTFRQELVYTFDVDFSKRQYLPEPSEPSDAYFNLMEPFLQTVKEIASAHHSLVVELGNQILYRIRKPNVFDYYACLFKIYRDVMGDEYDVPLPYDLLFNDVIFDPRVTFYSKSSFESVNYFRANAVELLLKCSNGYIKDALFQCFPTPLIFMEVLNRLSGITRDDILRLRSSSLASGLMATMSYYASFPENEASMARQAVMVFLIDSVKDLKLLGMFFALPEFSMPFLSLGFEESYRENAFKLLFTYISQNPEDAPEVLSSLVVIIGRMLDEMFQTNDYIPVIKSFIEGLTNALAFARTLAKSFEPLMSIICQRVTDIENNNESIDLLMSVISLLAIVSSEHTIQMKEVAAIEGSIIRYVNKLSADTLLIRLVHVLAGRQLSIENHYFEIQQPKVLCTFLRVFSKSDIFEKAIDVLINLCDYSVVNCRACHNGDLDLCILDLVEGYRVTGQVDSTIVSKLMSLFVKIAIVTSSVAVTQRFISLFTCIHGGVDKIVLPYYYSVFLETLNTLVSTSKMLPSASFPLNGKATACISNIPSNLLNDSFCFGFWFYNSGVPNPKITLISLSDANGNRLIVTLESLKLTVYLTAKDSISTGDHEIHVAPKSWQWIVIRIVHKDSTRCDTLVEVGNFPPKKIEKFCNLTFETPNLTAIINISDEKALLRDEEYSRMGPFTLFKTTGVDQGFDTKLEVLKVEPSNLLNPIFLYVPYPEVGIVSLKTVKSLPSMTLTFSRVAAELDYPFADILVNITRIETLIPLVAQLEFLTDNSRYIVKSTFDVIKNLLLLGEVPQNTFLEAHGFDILSFLLGKLPEHHITYDLYNSLYKTKSCIKVPELMVSLDREILLNYELWSRADLSNRVRIMQHWNRAWFTENDHAGFDVVSFEQMLENCEKVHKEDSSEKLKPVSDILFDICQNYVIHGRGKVDVIFSYLRQDNPFLMSYLSFINRLLQNSGLNSSFRMSMVKMLPLLCPLFNDTREGVLPLLVQVIHNSFNKDTRNPAAVMSCIMRQLRYKRHFFTQLVDFYSENRYISELAPFMIWSAINDGVDSIERLTSLYISGGFSFADQESIGFMVLLLYKTPLSLRESFCEALVKYFNEKWSDIIDFARMIGFSTNSLELMENLLQTLLSKMIYSKTDMSPSKVCQIVPAAFNFIIRRPKMVYLKDFCHFLSVNSYSNAFSMIDEKASIELGDSTMPARISPHIIVDLASEIIKDPSLVTYTLSHRFSMSGEWLDRKLTEDLVQIFTHFPHQKVYDKIVFLTALIAKEKPELSDKVIEIIADDKKTLIDSVYLNFLAAVVPEKMIAKRLLLVTNIDANSLKNGLRLKYLDMLKRESETRSTDLAKSLIDFTKLFCESQKTHGVTFSDITKSGKLTASKPHGTLFYDAPKVDEAQKERLWHQFWRSLTIDRAPWNSSVVTSWRGKNYYKRDKSICRDLYPAKLRVNYNPDDHFKASKARDLGNFETAEKETAERQIQKRRSLSAVFDTEELIDQSIADEPIPDGQNPTSFWKGKKKFPCTIIRIQKETPSFLQFVTGGFKIGTKTYEYTKIKFIYFRSPHHQLNSIELFLDGGKTYFLTLHQYFERVVGIFRANCLPGVIREHNLDGHSELKAITEKWQRWELTNFEYLMTLNYYSGRSFSSASLYPIFPWILTNYSSSSLDVSDPTQFRDLTKPMGALDPTRLEELDQKAQELRSLDMDDYLYGSGPIYPLAVFLYLIRLEPFTSLHIDMQGGRFDHAARLFYSIADTFRLATTQMSDFRELIPEFFFDSEFLINSSNFDLGSTEGVKINDVILPPWSKSPHEFIYMHRKALESDFVSSHLHDWIDLIFGVHQQSADKKNIYKREMYYDIWEKSGKDLPSDIKTNIRSILENVGQLPQKIFNEEHPTRGPKPVITPGEAKVNSHSTGSLKAAAIGEDVVWLINEENKVFSIKDRTLEETKTVTGNVLCIDEEGRVVTYDNLSCVVTISRKDFSVSIGGKTRVMALDMVWPYVAIGYSDTTVCVTDLRNEQKVTIKAFRDCVDCICISTAFSQMVCGTKDGALLFCSLTRGNIIKIVDLGGCKPHSILITKSSGFVLVYSTKIEQGKVKGFLHLFTINGTKIRETPLSTSIEVWCSWTDKEGFDWVTYFNGNNELCTFEAFYCNPDMASTYVQNEKGLAVKHRDSEAVSYLVTQTGRIIVIPDSIL